MKNSKENKFTTKKDLLEDQLQNPPFGTLAVAHSEIRRIHKTSGTTNKPLLVPMTSADIETTVSIGKKCFELSGLTPSDIVIHCLSYNMWMGGFTDHQSLEATGAAVIPFGVGHTKNLIETILLIKPTAIHCTPSYLQKIETVLEQEYHLKPIDLGIKLGLFGAESGLQDENFRRKIEEKWGMKAMNANYGMADVLSMFGAECYLQHGLHFMGEGVIIPELIDPDSLESLKIERGAVGELVLTNIKREVIQLKRYRTSDIIKILDTDTCSCGCSGFKFEVVGRADDMFVFSGVNVFVNAIQCIINEINLCSGPMEVYVSASHPIIKVLLKVELQNSIQLSDTITINKLKELLLYTVKSRLTFTPEIELVAYAELPRTESKTKKLFRTL